MDKPCTLKNVIRCPYHSWSYDFNGNLVATPHIGGLNNHQSEKFDKNKSSLKEVKSKIESEIKYDEKFLKSLDPSDEWDSRKIEEFENSIYEKNKDICFLDDRIRSWGRGVR